MVTKRCPLCAEEIPDWAAVCGHCGAPLGTGAPPAPAPPLGAPEALPPPAPVPPGGPVGEVREGVVASGRQAVGFYLHSLTAIAMLLAVALSFGGMRSLAWAERPSGIFLEAARPAPIFLVGAFVVILAWSLGVRRLVPRAREVGAKGVRTFRRTLREQRGISLLLARRGLLAGIVVAVAMWGLMEWSAIYNFNRIDQEGWTVRFGIYPALVLPVLGALAALLVWPSPRGRVVRMDAKGDIFE